MASTDTAAGAAPGAAPGAALGERALRPDDAPALLALSAEAGWNQTAADWRFMLEVGRGIGVPDGEGGWAASALAFPLGAELCWISMVLTARRWRRQGLGTRLLRRAIALARAPAPSGIAAAGLDATELGRPIYAALGFRELYALKRWRLDAMPAPDAPPEGVVLRAIRPHDLASLTAFDSERSGIERRHVLAHLLARAPALACIAEADGRILGYAMGRDGRFATQIGPVVAASEPIAVALTSAAARGARPPLLLDVPDMHAAMAAWLARAGGTTPRGFFRMVLGEAPGLADARAIFALAGPELA